MTLDFSLDRELGDLRSAAEDLASSVSSAGPAEDSWMVGHDRTFSHELGRRGWLGMTWPVEYGGGGRRAIERLVVYEALISAGAPVAASWFADRQIGPTLVRHGTKAQRDRYLPGILDGSAMWAIGLSEPDAGSDVASMRTRAELKGDHFRITGQKTWTSGAVDADHLYVVARTDPDAPPHAGLSEIIVDLDTPGVTVVPIRDLTGNRHFCDVFLDDVVVPVNQLVGEMHASFGQIMRQLELERGGIDRLVANRKLFDDVVALADLDDPLIRQDIAAIISGYHVGRLLVLRETVGQAPRHFSAVTKAYCTELEQRITSFCAGVLGPWSTLSEEGLPRRVARSLCYARAYTIMGGTAEVLRNIIGDRVLGLPR